MYFRFGVVDGEMIKFERFGKYNFGMIIRLMRVIDNIESNKKWERRGEEERENSLRI